MSTVASDRLYELLPALYRLEDAKQGRHLQALLRAVAEQAEILRQDVDRFWDDQFIETCRDWVVPYLGDLVGNNGLHDAGANARTDVARTVSYRRRKGTVPMLAELARDVTGWGAHVVEFFELLGWTQHLDHYRPHARWAHVRDLDAMDRVDGPFDETSHTVDIRPPGPAGGWHQIDVVGFFLYRLRSYPLQGRLLTDAAGAAHPVRPQPRQAGAAHRFHVSSLGAPAPLFQRWRPGDPPEGAREPFVPGPIRPLAFHEDLQAPAGGRAYYGAASLGGAAADPCDPAAAAGPARGSLAVFADGAEVAAERILCKDLSAWEQPGQTPPAGNDTVFVDVALGRLAFAPDRVPAAVAVEYHYGFSGEVGAGPYDRRRRHPTDAVAAGWGPDTVADPSALGLDPIRVGAVGADHTSLTDALAEWAGGSRPPVVVEIVDDRTYHESLAIDVTGASIVVLQAADGRRPTVVGDITVSGSDDGARVILDGLLVEGRVTVAEGANLRGLRLAHCTLVPGGALDSAGRPLAPDAPSLSAGADATALTVALDAAVVGGLRLAGDIRGLEARRSIIDGVAGDAVSGPDGDAGPPTDLRQVTVLGAVRVRTLPMASEAILAGPVQVQRIQQGCVRFSFVEPGSPTPRRYRCQPDLALDDASLTDRARAHVRAAMRPVFTSVRYHDPGYTQLATTCPAAIRTGAEDGSEMGVWAFLRNPQREANLRLRLDEYLPFGLEPALIPVT